MWVVGQFTVLSPKEEWTVMRLTSGPIPDDENQRIPKFALRDDRSRPVWRNGQSDNSVWMEVETDQWCWSDASRSCPIPVMIHDNHISHCIIERFDPKNKMYYMRGMRTMEAKRQKYTHSVIHRVMEDIFSGFQRHSVGWDMLHMKNSPVLSIKSPKVPVDAGIRMNRSQC